VPDFSRWGANGGDPSLNAIARTDNYLDALASEQAVYATDPADAELAGLMAGWRDEVRRPPARVAAQRDAEIVLQRALANRRRTRMSMAVMGSVAAALLCLGGFGAVVYGAAPGDTLYGLRVSLFGEQRVTRDDRVALAAQTEMQQVQQLIDQGNWDAAQDKLQTITSNVQTVEDPQRQQELQQQLNNLTVKVESRDPDATVPESAQINPIAPDAPAPPAGLPPIELPSQLPIPVPGQLPLPLPFPGPGAPLPLPGPGVPPDISLPPLPKPVPDEPKPLPDGPKPIPVEPKPDPDNPNPLPIPGPQNPKPAPKPEPQEPEPAPELPKPAPNPAPEPKPVPELPKQLIPDDIPMPKPAPVPQAPAPVQEAPPVPVAPKAPALAPQQEAPAPVEPSTTVLPIPVPKPGE
jgi:Anti-sigma-D factor RsdA to sigma factor binding region